MGSIVTKKLLVDRHIWALKRYLSDCYAEMPNPGAGRQDAVHFYHVSLVCLVIKQRNEAHTFQARAKNRGMAVHGDQLKAEAMLPWPVLPPVRYLDHKGFQYLSFVAVVS